MKNEMKIVSIIWIILSAIILAFLVWYIVKRYNDEYFRHIKEGVRQVNQQTEAALESPQKRFGNGDLIIRNVAYAYRCQVGWCDLLIELILSIRKDCAMGGFRDFWRMLNRYVFLRYMAYLVVVVIFFIILVIMLWGKLQFGCQNYYGRQKELTKQLERGTPAGNNHQEAAPNSP